MKGDYIDWSMPGDGEERRLQPPNGGPEEAEPFNYCWHTLGHEYSYTNDLGINPVIIKDLTVRDVYFPSGDFQTPQVTSTMIKFSPD